MDKRLTAALPKKRPYTVIEAVFSVQCDADGEGIKGLREYARIWSWSVGKVRNLLQQATVTTTDAPKNTQQTVKFRFINPLRGSSHRNNGRSYKRAPNGPANTTINLNPNPKTKNKDSLRLSSLLATNILKNNPKYRDLNNGRYENTIHRWSDEIDALRLIDGQTIEDIELIILWSQSHHFWKDVIISAKKLRQKWDQLYPLAKRTGDQPYSKADPCQARQDALQRSLQLEREFKEYSKHEDPEEMRRIIAEAKRKLNILSGDNRT
jgi:hypothetical protein